jgi:cellulose biosynthesis protein BcsQ
MTRYAVLSPSPVSGKSTTVVGLAAYLGAFGATTLVVDCDPLGEASEALGGAVSLDPRRVLARGLPLAACISPTIYPRVDLLRAGPASDRSSDAHIALLEIVRRVEHRYTYVVFDGPREGEDAMASVLAASTEAILTVPVEVESLSEIAPYIDRVEVVRALHNRALRLTLLLTMFDRGPSSEDAAMEIRRRYPAAVLRTTIPTDTHLTLVLEGASILEMRSRGANAYNDLAVELAGRASREMAA